jgi:SSS family solute:Na+ symporter
MFNILTGIIWQITLMAAQVYLVIREYDSLIICIGVLVITSMILKFNWWNKLEAAYGENIPELNFRKFEDKAA